MSIKLRPWQKEALDKALDWLLNKRKDRRFLINVAPGAGKTIAACMIARSLFECDEIDRVIVIAPRVEVVNQWAIDFKRTTGRAMMKVTKAYGDVDAIHLDICATWAAIKGLMGALQTVCQNRRVLVICDEHHHAAVEAAWGSSTNASLAEAKFALLLTGTPIRSGGESTIWLAYDDEGAIDHPEEGTYTLSYGQAVDLGYCRPATFHRHEGNFGVELGQENEKVRVSGRQPAQLSKELRQIPGLKRALEFYRLACTRLYEKDGKTPLLTGYQGTMLDEAGRELTDLRLRMSDAGGLVIAPNIKMAEYMAVLLEMLEQEKPMLVHNKIPNPDGLIRAFKDSHYRWLVSVAMISEGVDIPRLRVLVYLPYALTELAFRQAVGRVVRTTRSDDDTRAYILMPSFEKLEDFARRVEEEMPKSTAGYNAPTKKRCPICLAECERGAKICDECKHEFPAPPSPKYRSCHVCETPNPISAKFCRKCNASFEEEFSLTLEEAYRDGAIIRGMDIDETDVIKSKKVAKLLRMKVAKTGNPILIELMKKNPEEAMATLYQALHEVFGENGEDED